MIAPLLYAACAALLLLIVRQVKPEFAVPGGVLVTLTVCSAAVVAFGEVIAQIGDFSRYGIGEYVGVMLKVTGVCVCVDICSDLCEQCGYTSAAKGVIVYGRAQLLLLVLPYAQRLLSGVSALF